jgi:hypothetical protein
MSDSWDEMPNDKTNFSEHSEKYGKAVAAELHKTIINLNKIGVDYSTADNSIIFKERFYKDLYKVNQNVNMKDDIRQVDPAVFAEKVRNLTNIQIEFIQRIIKECETSASYQELLDKLLNINKDINLQVPEIEQERLYNITAVLYYGMKEIQNLEKQGQMLRTPHNIIQRVRLKSGSEPSDFGASCSKFLATTWAIAIGEPTPAGEIVATVMTVMVGGLLLYEVIVCSSSSDSSDYNHCQQKYQNCYSPIPDGCGICLQFCLVQGYWPPVSTHQCY